MERRSRSDIKTPMSRRAREKKGVEYFEGRVYPSTEVPMVRSKSANERPRLTPQVLRDMVKKFEETPLKDRLRIHWEHERSSDKEIGLVTGLRYDEKDKWLHMQGRIKEEKRDALGQILRDGKFGKGISLCYYMTGSHKDLIEISLVNNPDFDGAGIEYFHSEDHETLGKFHCPLKKTDLLLSILTNTMSTLSDDFNPDQHMSKLFDGSWMVTNKDHLGPAQQHVISVNGDPSKVFFEDPAQFAGIPPEKFPEAMALLRAENQRSIERLAKEEGDRRIQAQEEERKKRLESVLPLAQSAATLLKDDPECETVTLQLAEEMLTNPRLQSFGMLHRAQVSDLTNERDALAAENARLRQQSSSGSNQNRPSFSQPQPPSIMAHSGDMSKRQLNGHGDEPSQSFGKSGWEALVERFMLGRDPVPAEKSSASSSAVFQHSGDSRKRQDVTPTLESKHVFDNFDLFARSASSSSSSSSSVRSGSSIFSHSAPNGATTSDPERRLLPDVPEEIAIFLHNAPRLSELTAHASPEDITRAKFRAVVEGDYATCVHGHTPPKTWLTNNMMTKNPRMFTSMIMAHHASSVGTNQSDRVLGIKDGGNSGVSQRLADKIRSSPHLMETYCWDPKDFPARADAHFDNLRH